MEIRLNRDLLLAELVPMQGIVERRTTIPVLSHLLLRAEAGKLHLAATDLDVSLTSSLAALGLSAGFAGLAWGWRAFMARKRQAAEVARRAIAFRRMAIEIPHPRDWPVYDQPAEEKENP